MNKQSNSHKIPTTKSKTLNPNAQLPNPKSQPLNPKSQIDFYLKKLFPITRSITGNGNRETLKIIQEITPLTIKEIPSGTNVFDWKIPQEWNIKDAWIKDEQGNKLIDFKNSNIHIVSYSEPVDKIISSQQLKQHLHYLEDLPEAIPYRTTYYKKDWGFCVTKQQYETLKSYKGNFNIKIDSEFSSGSLSYGELLIPGQSKKEILISCYLCHPSMANDSLSGVLLTAFLAQYIQSKQNNKYSYRIIFIPETIGAISYCALNQEIMKQIDTGLVITTVGGPGKFAYKQSLNPEHEINQLVEEVFSGEEVDYITYPFDVHGSDERQYSSLGFRINTVTISKDKYYEYPYYHTSLDNLDFVNGEQINQTLELYKKLINKLEKNTIYKNNYPNCEVMLSKHNLYPATGGAQLPEANGRSELDIRLWLLFLCDGNLSISAIAKKLEVEEDILTNTANTLVEKGVLERII